MENVDETLYKKDFDMPMQDVRFCWLYVGTEYFPGESGVDSQYSLQTINFPAQRVSAFTAPTTWVFHQGSLVETNISALIDNYKKADGTVVKLVGDAKNNSFSDTNVVEVTFLLAVSSAAQVQVWAMGQVMLFG